MKRQRNVMSLMATASIAAMALAGCSATGGGDTGDAAPESNEITVAAQAWMVQKFHMADMVKKFEEANPGKTVTVVEYPDNQALSNFALQWSQGKSSQDLVVVDGASVAVQFLAKDLIVDFNKTKFFEGPTAKDKFIGETLAFDSLDGVQFAIPIGLETYNISANKTYFEKAGLLDANGDIPAPKDWNELYDMAKAMTVKSGSTVTMPGMTIQWGPNAMSTMIAVEQAVRGSFYKSDKKTLTFDTPEMREVLKIWKKGVDEGVFSIDTFANKDAGRSNFNAGNIPMVLETAAHVPEAAPTIGVDNSVVLAMPGSMENGSYGFTAGIIMPTASKNQNLAMKFIQEGMMSDVQVAVGLEWGKLPVIQEHFDKIDAPWKTAMYDLVKISQPAPMYRDLPEIQVTGKQMLQDYLTGKVDLDKFIGDLESLIDKANKDAK
ncbi:ABC-type glycerol-3-phosphate transport system substrate-binding protein [Cryobacterium mesophilum]|uniref:Extracellular solute-binding protein n=1 Tax=Terrimesophilobacter mesophilus TaxID=433647 RepID=A0A4R8VE11_9MICO|nr:extracellular solute-binding protein [Terrimesophilobacter mesophilus]MBB5633714.1 ABC-type glycerol-3-phosphate transport system substrate-binding protein [Terrimesophilobacter mesophilus]TFB80400.1 extracellular solute-binding protein [Terrimesophilobacter mesophilus]